MEKLLRFRDLNGSEVFYPESSFLGISVMDTDIGDVCLRLHFKPLRSTTQSHAGTADSDFDTDTISIRIDDILETGGSYKGVATNLLRGIATSTGVVDVFVWEDSTTVTTVLDNIRDPFTQLKAEATIRLITISLVQA